MLSANDVMANILHLAQNMDEKDAPDATSPHTSPPPISAFVAADRGSHSGRGRPPRVPRGGRVLPTKCTACGSPDHILSSSTAPDDALLRLTLAKRKLIIQKYGTPGGSHSVHAVVLSDVPADDSTSLPTLEECTDEYDDTEASVPFNSVAFSSSLTPARNLSHHWVVDSACSINLTAFKDDFVRFASHSAPSRVLGVGVDVKGSGSVRISVKLASGLLAHRTVHALYTLDLSSRPARRIGRLLSVSWMQTHSACESIFVSECDTGLLVVHTGMGVLEPSGNGLYLLPHQSKLPLGTSAMTMNDPSPSVALAG
jgi:hypothetical protein